MADVLVLAVHRSVEASIGASCHLAPQVMVGSVAHLVQPTPWVLAGADVTLSQAVASIELPAEPLTFSGTGMHVACMLHGACGKTDGADSYAFGLGVEIAPLVVSPFVWDDHIDDLLRYLFHDSPWRLIVKNKRINKMIYPRTNLPINGAPQYTSKGLA